MTRWPIPTFLSLLLLSSALVAGQSSSNPKLFSSDLVAWSYMQQPEAPENRPQRQQPKPDPTRQSQPAPTPTNQPNANSHESWTAQTFTGTISKEESGFALKVSDTTSYKLDNQQQVQQYQGRRVRVTGTLDPSLNLIHVDRIEPLS